MLSRVEICAKYRLQPVTFDVVAPLLHCVPVEQNGRVLYDVGPVDDFIFTCARLHPASFAAARKNNARLFPFHRFLVLKFLTVSLDELINDIRQRHLAPGMEMTALRHAEREVHALLPKTIRDLAKKRLPPPDPIRDQYMLLLKIVGIDSLYLHPTFLDDYLQIVGDPEAKLMLETVLTTHGSASDWQAALVVLSRFKWDLTALQLYASVFYDRDYLTESDWQYYLRLLMPSERLAKIAALEMTTEQLCAREAKTVEFMKTMRSVATNVQARIMKSLDDETRDFRELQTLLVTFNSLGKALGESDEVPRQSAGYFQSVKIRVGDDDDEVDAISEASAEGRTRTAS